MVRAKANRTLDGYANGPVIPSIAELIIPPAVLSKLSRLQVYEVRELYLS